MGNHYQHGKSIWANIFITRTLSDIVHTWSSIARELDWVREGVGQVREEQEDKYKVEEVNEEVEEETVGK